MSQKRQAIFIADLGFGDAGKGTITDFLTRELAAHTIVRYNGGPQAAHNVVTPDGRHHTFSQFGSGMLLPWTKTLLSRFMLINPLNMLKEERHLSALGVSDALGRTWIDRRALVVTPFQKAVNRLREIARAADRHGSCGEGIGECMADALNYGDAVLFAGDLQDRATVIKKLEFLRAVKRAEIAQLQLPDNEQSRQERAIFLDRTCSEDCADVYHYFAESVKLVDEAAIHALFAQSGTILFEGAQGVLLDENYGFAPYTTWSTTTFANAETLMREHDYTGEISRLGVVRAYATRHGAGPFPTEDHALTRALPDLHNTWNDWQQTFRVGHFDLVATRYARDVLVQYPQTDRKKEALRTPSLPAAQLDAEYQKKPERSSDFAPGKLDYLAVTHMDRLETIPHWQICTAYDYQGKHEDLSPYFEQEGKRPGKLTKMKVQRPVDLAHQERLTQRLWSCTPEYQMFSERYSEEDSKTAYLSLLEEQLSVPIAIVSHGPTAVDKQIISQLIGVEG